MRSCYVQYQSGDKLVSYNGRTEIFEKKENKKDWGNPWPPKNARQWHEFYASKKAK